MPLITDPDSITPGTEVVIDTSAYTIQLVVAGNLSNDGITEQCVYSYLVEEWNNNASLIIHPFPMKAIDADAGKFVIGQNSVEYNSWRWADDTTRGLIRSGGWQEYNASGTLLREYVCPYSGSDVGGASQPYFFFASDTSPTDFNNAGAVDEAVQTYGAVGEGNFDKRAQVLTVAVRTQGQTFDSALSTDLPQLATTVKPMFAPLPLSEETDIKISASDATISTTAPWNAMTITFYATPQSLAVGASNYNFGIVIDGNGGTIEEIYEFLQYQLRQNSDIDAGAGTHNGKLTDPFAVFVGDRLDTLPVTNSEGGGTGVYIQNFDANDTADIRLIDNTGTYRTFPFVTAGDIIFNATAQADTQAVYRMVFLETAVTAVSDLAFSGASGSNASMDSAGANLPALVQNDYIRVTGAVNAGNNGLWQVTDATPTTSQADVTKVDGLTPVNETAFAGTIGMDPYGTDDAVTVDNNSGVDIQGTVGGASSVSFDFDYDGNVQGGRTAGTDAEVRVVCIGEGGSQFVVADATLTRATGLQIRVSPAEELNFSNP